MSDYTNWLENLDSVRNNPQGIQRLALARLESLVVDSGRPQQIVDPSNPVVFLLEASSVAAANGIIQNEALARKQYPSMALTEDEVYHHMSDKDYVSRFATPARSTFTILLGKDELYARARPTGVGNIRKLVIPRHTEFSVADIKFTMQYAIEIRIKAHGGLEIVYDLSETSPLQTLNTNLLDWKVVNIENLDFVRIEVPVQQFSVTSHLPKLNRTSAFSATYTFADQYFYTRVYASAPGGIWREILTTHTDQVFDPLTPTALLKVTQGRLTVSIPQIYLTQQLVDRELRIDVYTTKGPLDMILANYQMNAFTVRWVDLGGSNSEFSAPLSAFNVMAIYSDKTVSGGTGALSFNALRDRVMKNALGSPNLPITNVQITTRLEDLGYDVVKDVDNITNRDFLATRLLPRPVDRSVVSGAGATMQNLIASMDDLVDFETVVDNGNRITILPSSLYQNINGVVSLLPQSTVDILMAMPVDVRARRVNESRYLYSPFHYVYDMNDEVFEHRPYFLDNPTVVSKSFVGENDTAGVAAAVGAYQIDRVDDGYLLTITCRSGQAWKDLTDMNAICQLSYKPVGEKDRAFQNATLIGTMSNTGERVYTFLIGTNYDIDAQDNICLNTFQMYDEIDFRHYTPLLTDFDITFIAGTLVVSGLQPSVLDDEIGKELLPDTAIALSRERLEIRLGNAMSGLWASSRSVISSQDYQKHLVDVPALYEQVVYERDPVTNQIVMTLDGDDNLVYSILHEVGDPMLDGEGDPIIKFNAGDIVVDAEGDPIPLSSRTMIRQCNILFLDGVYWFATEASAVEYKQSLPITIVGWLLEDIAAATPFLLEQTNVYFYPKSTLGQISAIVREDQRAPLMAEQSFSVTYYLSGVAFRDAALRSSLTQIAVETINEVLQSPVVTMNDITSKLTAKVGGDVIGVEVMGLGGSTPYAAVSLEDDSARLSIKKIAVSLSDGTIGVEDDVAVSFIQHVS